MIQDFINMYIVFAISLTTLGYLIPYTYDFVMKLKENKNKEKIFWTLHIIMRYANM